MMNWIRSKLKPINTNDISTPLHDAVLYESADVMLELINNGADVNAVDKSKHTPLHKIAFLLNDDEIYDKTRILLNNDAKINAQTMTGTTLLHWAVVDLSTDLVSLLLDKGADTTITDMWGYTPADMAQLYGKDEICELLQ
jgi:ankyrin repeat protein